MIAAEKGDGWRFNLMQFFGVFVWHMLGMPESDYPIVKALLKCWLIAGRSSICRNVSTRSDGGVIDRRLTVGREAVRSDHRPF